MSYESLNFLQLNFAYYFIQSHSNMQKIWITLFMVKPRWGFESSKNDSPMSGLCCLNY